MTDLHRRLMALAVELTERGDRDLAKWIVKHVAGEQRAESRRRGNRQARRRKVRVVGAGGRESTAWIAAGKLREGKEKE